MIPTFPNFKNIEWDDRAEVETFTSEFPPYSDFNFISMWSWNTRKKMCLSLLNGNLVLLFYDYIAETPFLTFIGKYAHTDTANTLIEYSKQKLGVNHLKLIPEAVAMELSQEKFTVTPDEDSHDYIASVGYLSKLDSRSNADKRAYQCKKFFRLYPHHTVKICPVNAIHKEEYTKLFTNWAKTKSLNHLELNEYSAFERFIQNDQNDNAITSVYDGDKLIGFFSYEIIGSNYAISHFGKAYNEYPGIYNVLHFLTSKELQKSNVEYWNFEQDLGIPTLRESKRKINPVFYLKKFIVELK